MIARAIRGLCLLALAGLLGCAAASPVDWVADDGCVDEVWAALQRGDVGQAERAAQRLADPVLRERARLDVLAARAGRSAACVDALDRGGWLAARYLSSDERARGPGVGHVDRPGEDGLTDRADRVGRGLEARLVPAADGDGGAFARQPLGNGEPYAPGAAGDQGGSSPEPEIHDSPGCRRDAKSTRRSMHRQAWPW